MTQTADLENPLEQDVHGNLQDELLAGLLAPHKYIDPKFLYDARGSALFTRICGLPEYYLTRTEVGILRENAGAITRLIGPDCALIEPGAGNCEKVRHLLPALQPAAYIPVDISREFLLESITVLSAEFPGLHIQPIIADFSTTLEIPAQPGGTKRVLFYPGSTIGNFDPIQALDFLSHVSELLGADGGLLIGVDLVKDHDILHAAYNDSLGITAEFNRNILLHVNALLGSNFNPQYFDHRAFYNAPEKRIEMHLVSTRGQTIIFGDQEIRFVDGEAIHTENSYKYSLDSFRDLAGNAGFHLCESWRDSQDLFSVHYLEVAAID